MSTPSEHGAQLVAGKKKVCSMRENEESAKVPPVTSSGEAEEDEIYYITEETPYFDVILSKSHTNPPWQLNIPSHGLSIFPRGVVPVVLRHGGKSWTVQYIGEVGKSTRPRFDSKWKNFVIDNKLEVGDACVFEVINPTSEVLTFKVHILRGVLPPELEALLDIRGGTSNSPIVID